MCWNRSKLYICIVAQCPSEGSSQQLRNLCKFKAVLVWIELIIYQSKNNIVVCLCTPFHAQNQIHSNQLRRAEQESRCLQESVQTLTVQNKDLHVQLQEIKRRQAEIECKVKLCY